MHSVIFAIISTLLILIGLIGTILPFIPGVFIAWLGILIFALGTGFERISVLTTIIFFILMLLTLAFDLYVPMLMAKRFKANSWKRTLGGSLGSYLGRITMGSPGLIFGPFLGSILGELVDGWRHGQTVKMVLGIFLGIIAGILIKIIVVLIMLGFLIASWF